MSKTLDVICLGRVAVDLYAQQIGSRLEDASSFAKYLGGIIRKCCLWNGDSRSEVVNVGKSWR